MLPLIPILAGLGLGGARGAVDMVNEGKQRKVQAATTLWSPWTGMKAAEPKRADMLGSLLSGGLTGAMMGNMAGGGGGEVLPALKGSTVAGDSTNLWDYLKPRSDYQTMYA